MGVFVIFMCKEKSEMLARVDELQQALVEGFARIEARLSNGTEFVLLLSEVLDAQKQKILRSQTLELQRSVADKWHARIRSDSILRSPHRKILECLLVEYDFERQMFQEVNFSRLVEKARIGKSMANRYLEFLEGRGYVEKRTDGYRVYFRLAEKFLCNEPEFDSVDGKYLASRGRHK